MQIDEKKVLGMTKLVKEGHHLIEQQEIELRFLRDWVGKLVMASHEFMSHNCQCRYCTSMRKILDEYTKQHKKLYANSVGRTDADNV